MQSDSFAHNGTPLSVGTHTPPGLHSQASLNAMGVETPIASPRVPMLEQRVRLLNIGLLYLEYSYLKEEINSNEGVFCDELRSVLCFFLNSCLQAPKKPKPLTLLPLIALIFYDVSGGPFGIEVRNFS